MDWSGPSVCGKNVAAGDVGAVMTAQDRVHVFVRGTNNKWQHWPGGRLASSSPDPWDAYGQTHAVVPAGHCYPGSLEELVAIVKEAGQLSRQVRAVGSGWSFSDVGVTTDYIVETNLLNSQLTQVLKAKPGVLNKRGKALKLFHVEAGITIVDLNHRLDRRSLALPTMGGSSGQTLAGAVSTCVHGADIDVGPLPNCVRAIHLVGPDGIQHWIEPTRAITNKPGLSAVLGLDPAHIHYDDDWFNSVLVSVGSMGIIYSLIIEVEAQFKLEDNCRLLNWDQLRAQLASGDLFVQPSTGPPIRSVQVGVNQFKSGGTHKCYLTTRTKAPMTATDTPAGDSMMAAVFMVTGDVIQALIEGNPDLISNLNTFILESNLLEPNLKPKKKIGIAHLILASEDPPPVRTRGLEIAFDATTSGYLTFMDEALQILDDQFAAGLGLAGYVSMRFVGSSRAYLSPQHQSALTCMVEIVGLKRVGGTNKILDLLEDAARRHGGIQHWGMFSPDKMSAPDVSKAFKDLDKWLGVRAVLTNCSTVHTFDNAFTKRSGLTNPPTPRIIWNGNHKASRTVWRPSTGEWWVINSSDGTQSTHQWGQAGDIPVPGDYDGDGKTDLAVWRPSTGEWWVINSSDGTQSTHEWGQAGDIPVPGDYDGDGKTDLAVWRPSTGEWWVINSSDGTQSTHQWGQAGDIPVPDDYDGDGKTDLAVWRPSTGEWWVTNSSDGAQHKQQWGQPCDVPVPGTYYKASRTDLGVWRPSTGEWWVINSSAGTQHKQQWGQAGDVPVPGDYDGDGKTDMAVWRPTTGEWWVINSSDGAQSTEQWGKAGDVPI